MTYTCTTPRFGPVHYTDDDVISLDKGIVPFVAATRFVLLHNEDEEPFAWLQSIEDAALAFAVAPLDLLFPDHAEKVRISLEQREDGRLPSTAVIYGIVVLHADPAQMSVNLLAPLVIDMGAMVGRQLVLDASLQLARQPLQTILGELVPA